MLTYVDCSSTTNTFDALGVGIGTIRTKVDNDSQNLRIGISYWFNNEWQVFADYQHATFENPAGDLSIDQHFTGASTPFSKVIYGRLGYIIDEDSNESSTISFEIYPNDSIGFEISRQHSIFPEIEQEFGKSDLVNISACFLF